MLARRANAQKEGVDRSGWLVVGAREQRWDAVRCPKPDACLHSCTCRQAKAGQPDAAFATYRRMLAAGAAPNSWTFSMLVSACGRGRQPARASEVVERLMPQVKCCWLRCCTTCPDAASWGSAFSDRLEQPAITQPPTCVLNCARRPVWHPL